MKILMTADAVGGVFTYAFELASGLAEHDVDVVLAVVGPPPSRIERRRLDEAQLAGVVEHRCALEWMDDPWDDVERCAEWLCELVELEQPDLVHLNQYAYGALELEVPKVVVGHSCVLSWHEAVRGRRAGTEWKRYRAAVAAGLRGADLVVAPTRAYLAALERLYGALPPTAAVPNGLACDGLRPLKKEELVLGVGRFWDEAKNLAALERLAERLDAPVAVAGDGAPLGRVGRDELAALYGRAAVFASPALYEPFGLAAIEAALCGCALVLGDLPTLREVWHDDATFVDPRDVDALVEACDGLFRDRERRERLGRAARRRALSYSRERMVAAYLDLYRRLRGDARAERAAAEALS